MRSEQTIPKYIHYCWFGGKPLSKKYLENLKTWQAFFPDYELILWNEENFPIDDYPYAKEAYEHRKFAFVSDVAQKINLCIRSSHIL